MKNILLCIFLLLVLDLAYAQDGHYSRYTDAPLFTNPANTGGEIGDLRAGLNYRSQWAQVADPYRTIGAFMDVRKNNLGLGLMVNQNDAGEASLKRSQIGLNFGLHKKLANGNNKLSLGGSIGFVQQRFDPYAFTYDQQYSPSGGNPLQGSGEQFEQTNMILPDFGVGVNYQFAFSPDDDKLGGELGVSFAHLNSPGASFYNELISFPLKTSIQAGVNYKVNEDLILEPRVLWMKQQEARELLMSVHANYRVATTTKVAVGAGIRKADAMILYGGLVFKNWNFGLSYDLNTSGLKAVSNGNGAIEFSAMVYLNSNNNAPSRQAKIALDSDGDGIPDTEDLCPATPGEEAYGGCLAPAKPNSGVGIRDIDGDGVSDDNDLCPYQPGLAKYQGCNDKDGDGIWDHLDACPSLSGAADNYGCPTGKTDDLLDSDGDGVVDRADECVYVPGLPSLRGCPDSDMDGIVDNKDNCPYIYGPKSNIGCPLESNTVEDRRISVESVEFDTDKAIIRSQYFPMLDRVAYELRFNDQYHLQLEGHTDSEGDALYNYHLSKRRAYAVQRYLMERGLSQDRISISYMGEEAPKATNSMEEGKQRNRRTELILIQR